MFDKIYNKDCYTGLQELDMESVELCVTSPPYFNAREYSNWKTVDDYMRDMKNIFTEVYRVLKNHRYIVVNVGDVTCQTSEASWSSRKLPLGAMFTMMLEEVGFQFVDDYIWDKGEPQTKRHLGNPPFPFYQYPVNCYEHILVFVKHRLDKEKIPCPVCHTMLSQSNSCSGIGVQSWECKNPECSARSEHGRGKRFSVRSVMMQDYQVEDNRIDREIVNKWRRDIVPISPVLKINSKGENTVGHTAPFPEDIPEMAIRFYSGVGDTVMDVFSGTGTTCKVAKKLQRHYIGYEINKAFYDLSVENVEGTQPLPIEELHEQLEVNGW